MDSGLASSTRPGMTDDLDRYNMTIAGRVVFLSPLPACGERPARFARCATG